jgi:hypothetical protein
VLVREGNHELDSKGQQAQRIQPAIASASEFGWNIHRQPPRGCKDFLRDLPLLGGDEIEVSRDAIIVGTVKYVTNSSHVESVAEGAPSRIVSVCGTPKHRQKKSAQLIGQMNIQRGTDDSVVWQTAKKA